MTGSEASATSRVHELSRDECEARLEQGSAGRVAFDAGDGPVVLPVSYVYTEGRVVFRTAPDSQLGRLAVPHLVAFEIDDLGGSDGTAWSVLVRGRSYQVRSAVPFVTLLNDPRLVPWAEGPRRLMIAVEPSSISGRRLLAP